jgi:HEXXH motif-containing protein
MNSEEASRRGFACPHEGIDESYLQLLVVEQARQVCERFLDRHADRLTQQSSGLASVLSDSTRRGSSFETTWDMTFGAIYSALFLNEVCDADRRACALALRLHECGRAGEWELRLQRPTRLRFDRWLLPRADKLKVTATDGRISIHASGEGAPHRAIFQRGYSEWRGTGAARLPKLAKPGSQWIILTADAIEDEGFEDVPSDIDRQVPDCLVARCEEAMSLLEDHAQIYVRWINRVVRRIVPLQSIPNMTRSGSDARAPGVIFLSNEAAPVLIGEMLVHEATHQYLFIAGRLEKLDDGTDQTLYFSSVRKVHRPLYFIVLAYHAVGNILLFYRALRESGFPDKDMPGGEGFMPVEGRLKGQLATLEETLQNATALTALGRALWQPLYARIHE